MANDQVTSFEQVSRAFPGFRWLIRFLDQAIFRALPSSTSPNHGYFPAEIYEMILDQVDDFTYLSCARVCRHFRSYRHTHLRLGRGLIVTRHLDGVKFVVEGGDDGKTTIAKWRPRSVLDVLGWSALIGPLDRPSLLLDVALSFRHFFVTNARKNHPRYALMSIYECE